MKYILRILSLIILLCAACRDVNHTGGAKVENEIRHAQGFSLQHYDGFSVVEVHQPWPNATSSFKYILQRDGNTIPDSLENHTIIPVPIKNIVVTSTTHIPSLEMLGVTETLTAFPNLSYISSEQVRSRIDAGKIRELGQNQSLNIEVLIDLEPDVVIAFGIDNNNPVLDNLMKSGIKIMFNGDWNEQSPLGKAEWVRLFGALFNLDDKAEKIFNDIEKEYNETLDLVSKKATRPTVMAGAIYNNNWYLPHGDSWGARLISEAGGNYLWKNSTGTGSLSLPFEKVFEAAEHADIWIGPAQYVSLQEMADGSDHYKQFNAFKKQQVYSFSTRKGKTGGVIYYELAPNRPDLVLKDLDKIFHPDLLPNHELFFFEKLL